MSARPGETPVFDHRDFPRAASAGYLNSAGMGLVALPVLQHFQAEAEAIATGGTLAYFDRYAEVIDEPRRAAARLFKANARDVAIINSVSELFSQLAAALTPHPGRNVVMIDIDHPSTTYPWLRAATEHGLVPRFVRSQAGSFSTEDVIQLIDKQTLAVSVSHVNWNTGVRLDLVRLAAAAHQMGALLLVDATHSAGVLALDGPGSGVDLLATASFKWLCGFSGVGAGYVAPELTERLFPVMLGSRSSDPPPPFANMDSERIDLPEGAKRWEYGSSAHVLRIAFARAIDYVMAADLDRLTTHTQALGTGLAEALTVRGFEVLTPLEPNARAGIITARHPNLDGPRLCAALERAGVITAPRLNAVRFAPHGYNSWRDVDAAVQVIDEVLAGGAPNHSGLSGR